jgi:hypothetical protein
MADALAASMLPSLLGLELGPTGQDAGNRFSVENVTVRPNGDGALEVGAVQAEAASLRIAAGPFVLEIGRLALHHLIAQVRVADGRPTLASLDAAGAELSRVTVHGPVAFPAQTPGEAASATWSLGPLAAADGTVRAQIVDAHLMFDADVTVPVRQGQIDFNHATVEHVGPDSRMGVSKLGLYVDAPNGRSYLYQFSSAVVAGVEYERRGALLGPWITERGKLRLQEFGEALLRQGRATAGPGFTDQARLLLDRTSVSGEVQLGDASFAAPGVQAELVGRAEGRNAVRLHSEAVGRGVTLELASLSVRKAVLHLGAARLECDEITGTLKLRLSVENAQVRFAFDVESLKISGLHLPLAKE